MYTTTHPKQKYIMNLSPETARDLIDWESTTLIPCKDKRLNEETIWVATASKVKLIPDSDTA